MRLALSYSVDIMDSLPVCPPPQYHPQRKTHKHTHMHTGVCVQIRERNARWSNIKYVFYYRLPQSFLKKNHLWILFIYLSISSVWVHSRSLQSSPALCDPVDYSLTPSQTSLAVGLSRQAYWRILEWVATLSSRESPWPRHWIHASYVSGLGRRVLYHGCHPGSPLLVVA